MDNQYVVDQVNRLVPDLELRDLITGWDWHYRGEESTAYFSSAFEALLDFIQWMIEENNF